MAKRFVKTYSQGVVGSGFEIYVDREAGVNYLSHWGGSGGGITPLLNQQGKPIVTDVRELED